MNDDLHTFIEPELQARIAALVLGEASEFERDELEKLIAEKPELAIYQRRIKAMHDLLGEVVKPERDTEWQLSKEKRNKLRQKFAKKEETTSSGSGGNTRGGYRVQIRSAVAIAACVLFTVVLFFMATPALMKKSSQESADALAQHDVRGGLDLHDSMSAPEDRYEWSAERDEERTVSRKVKSKPSAPSSGMRKAVASNTTAPSAVPVPKPAVNAPAVDSAADFGNGDGYGDGWGKDKNGKERGRISGIGGGGGGGQELPESESDPFGAPDAAEITEEKPAIAGKKMSIDRLTLSKLQQKSSEVAKSEKKYTNYRSKTEGEKLYKIRDRSIALQAGDDLDVKDGREVANKKAQLGVPSGGTKLRDARPGEPLREDMAGEAGSRLANERNAKLNVPKSGNNNSSGSFYFREARQAEQKRDLGSNHDDDSFLTGKPSKGIVMASDGQPPVEMPEEIEALKDVVGKDTDGIVPGADMGRPVSPRGVSGNIPRIPRAVTGPSVSPESAPPVTLDFLHKAKKNNSIADKEKARRSNRFADEADGKSDVSKELYTGEGYYNLGDYDRAEAEMKKVLQKDPSNKAARRWLEKVNDSKSDYYRSAYDETHAQLLTKEGVTWKQAGAPQMKAGDTARAKLLAEVDRAWAMDAPKHLADLPGYVKDADERAQQTKSELKSLRDRGIDRQHPKVVELEGRLRERQEDLSRVTKVAKNPTARPKPLPDETLTTAEPFSTFSLNVNDVSFKLARVALLEKGQWPDAAKVRTEEFVNAFDYGDPSPRRGEPVACAIEQAAHPFLQQRNLLRVGMKTAAMGRSQPLRLTILLDNSGSMEREDREESVLAAMQVLAAQLNPQDVITVVSFARQPRLIADRIPGHQAAKLVDLVAKIPSEGGTNLEEALRLARTLAKRQHSEGAQSRIVLITDGVANLGNTVPEQLSNEVETMRQEGIAFDACGVGAEGLNDDILEALTRKGDGRYYFLNRPEDADAGFVKQLAGALTPAAKNVKVQVVFNPKRVARYRLLGFEKHRLNKEDFRNDKVDAAEMAAEEAGNAVYQIQVNPQGEGELGEVFVRFLDASTGRMVERSWPLAYQPQAKPFDLATPSMQLAGTAAMLGEKLHGTDAGSVRFSMISDTLGKIKAHYASDTKVQDLIRMCRKAE